MTDKKKTKRALIASIISLMLCFTMLLGTTYAWFTDSVTSTNNIIKSGNLDVVLEYYDAERKTWVEVDGDTSVFTEQPWEPGHTEVVYLKVTNAGSLALKYSLGVNVASETKGTNTAGETFKLSDFIEFGVIESNSQSFFDDRADARAAVTDAKVISTGYTKSNTLLADGEKADFVTLVVYMPETVGNVANHKVGTKAPVINLGISLFATQVEAERDSFGDDYDGGISWDGTYPTQRPETFVIDTEKHTITLNDAEAFFYLNAFYAGSANAVTFPDSEYWGYDIILNTDIDLMNQPFTPIVLGNTWMNANYYEICTADARFETWGDRQRGLGNIKAYGEYSKFDGNGHTISNVYINSKGNNLGLFSTVNNVCNLNIENVTIVAANDTYDAGITVGALAGSHANGIVDRNAAEPEIVNVSVKNVNISGNGKYSGGLIGYSGHAIIEGCTVENAKVSGTNSVGAVIGFADAFTCKINNCKVDGADLSCTRTDRIGYLAGRTNLTNNTKMSVENSVFAGIKVNGAVLVPVGTNHGSIPTYTNNVVEVATPDELAAALSNVQPGVDVSITNDIDMTGVNWTPVNMKVVNLVGKDIALEGNGHKITDLNVVSSGNAGLIGVAGCTTWGNFYIRDLTFENAKVVCTAEAGKSVGAGVIAGWGAVNLENCAVIDSEVSGAKYAGGVVGYDAAGGNIRRWKNVTVTGTTVIAHNEGADESASAGALIGYSQSTSVFDGITVKNNTVSTTESVARAYVGSLIGTPNNIGTTEVENGFVFTDLTADTTADKYAGRMSENITVK